MLEDMYVMLKKQAPFRFASPTAAGDAASRRQVVSQWA
jgi:hypothetical protein